jgi:hypothetical protein
MKLDDFNEAKRLQERILEFDKMCDVLCCAAQDVKNQHKDSDAEDLALLIMKLVETNEGERVLDYIVNTFAMKFEKDKRELEKRFDEL